MQENVIHDFYIQESEGIHQLQIDKIGNFPYTLKMKSFDSQSK